MKLESLQRANSGFGLDSSLAAAAPVGQCVLRISGLAAEAAALQLLSDCYNVV
jgi:hypothetical protein